MPIPLFEVFIRVTKFKIKIEKIKQKELKEESMCLKKEIEELTMRDLFYRRYKKDVVLEDLKDIFCQSEPLDLSES